MALRKTSVLVVFIVASLLSLIICGFAQAQQPITQFGNTSYNSSWNVMGGWIVASQFHIDQSLTVNWMSVLTQDNSPPSYLMLGILSDNNNQPSTCLASTNIVPSQVSNGWYTVPLTSPVTLQPGNYWLAEVDSGATVMKFIDTPGSSSSVYAFVPANWGALSVGSQITSKISTPLNSLIGTLAIVASSIPSNFAINPTTSFANYAEGAQCWTSASISNPYPIQTSFQEGTPVYIYWSPYNPNDGAVDISIYPPNGRPGITTAYSSFIDITPDKAPQSFTPNQAGTWIISCNGYSTIITITPVNVFALPEYALGALMSIVACFLSILVFRRIHARHL
jgi:hypothetical protein